MGLVPQCLSFFYPLKRGVWPNFKVWVGVYYKVGLSDQCTLHEARLLSFCLILLAFFLSCCKRKTQLQNSVHKKHLSFAKFRDENHHKWTFFKKELKIKSLSKLSVLCSGWLSKMSYRIKEGGIGLLPTHYQRFYRSKEKHIRILLLLKFLGLKHLMKID